MNQSSRTPFHLNNAVVQYFGSGWAFFLPYLLLYLLFWACDWRVPALTAIFYFLHGIHAIGLAYFIRLRFRFIDWRTALFWMALASLFFNVGAYLEFPSDPWKHLWRIFQWQRVGTIAEAEASHKFAYFLGYTLTGWVKPENQKLAVDAYYMFWSLLLALQFHRLALKCSLSEPWAKMVVFGTVLLMGNSSFGFYRYYGISSTMLSMTAYLAALNATIEYTRSKKNLLWIPVGFALLLACCNHMQGILLYLATATGIVAGVLVQKLGWRTFLMRIVPVLLIAGVLFRLLVEVPWLENFKATLQPIWDSGDWLYEWGGLKIFSFTPQINNASGRFLQIIGILGVFNLMGAIFLIRKHNLAAWITLSPMLLMLYPPCAIPLAYLLVKYDSIIAFQRVLLAIPQGLCLIILVRNACQSLTCKAFRSYNIKPIIAVTLIICSMNPAPHFFGRFHQAFIRTPEQLSLGSLTQTAQWLDNNFTLKGNEYILSDKATQFAVSTHLKTMHNGRMNAGRRITENLATRIDSLGGAEGILQSPEIAGVLALAKQPEINPVGSLLGKASGHWQPQTMRMNLRFIPSLEKELQPLIEHGWQKIQVPPWYTLYARPREIP